MPWPYVVHQIYNRQLDIHQLYGGQHQGGISTPASSPGIFIFTGSSGIAVGYKDAFQADGSLRYTGQGQIGDMRMKSGNAAILDHSSNGKDLLLFSQVKKGGQVRFEGLFVCSSWETERQPDINGDERDAIVFTLAPLCEDEVDADAIPTQIGTSASLTELRKLAVAAAKPAERIRTTSTSSTTLYQRSQTIRNYVLARADGKCEACGNPAPFITSNGQPYLEAHHIRRLSDGGPDDPLYVAAICPNCHRRAHVGEDRASFNDSLYLAVQNIENRL